MISGRDLIKKTGMGSQTLQRYRDMGLIRYAKIEYRGNGKEVYYEDDTVETIKFIDKMRAKGHKLHEIRDMLAEKKEQSEK